MGRKEPVGHTRPFLLLPSLSLSLSPASCLSLPLNVSPSRSPIYSGCPSPFFQEEELEAQVSFLQGQINDLEAMCKYCAKMMNMHIGKSPEASVESLSFYCCDGDADRDFGLERILLCGRFPFVFQCLESICLEFFIAFLMENAASLSPKPFT